MSFLTYINDACGALPLLIYRAEDFPTTFDIIGRGSDCEDAHASTDFKTCALGDKCIYDYFYEHISFSSDADYVLVISDEPTSLDNVPRNWLYTVESRCHKSFELVCVSAATIKAMIEAKEPLVCVWEYDTGPRAYCQHGGDEDWTAIVRSSTYDDPTDEYRDELEIEQWLDCCGASQETEGDFRVYTGAHA